MLHYSLVNTMFSIASLQLLCFYICISPVMSADPATPPPGDSNPVEKLIIKQKDLNCSDQQAVLDIMNQYYEHQIYSNVVELWKQCQEEYERGVRRNDREESRATSFEVDSIALLAAMKDTNTGENTIKDILNMFQKKWGKEKTATLGIFAESQIAMHNNNINAAKTAIIEAYSNIERADYPISILTYEIFRTKAIIEYTEKGLVDAKTTIDKFIDECKKDSIPNKSKGIECALYADALLFMGDLHSKASKHDQAVIYYNRSIRTLQECYGEEHIRIAEAYYSMGVSYVYVRDTTSAVKSFRQAIDNMRPYKEMFSEKRQHIQDYLDKHIE